MSKDFEGNNGTAKVTTAGAQYPLLRSQKSNLNFSAAWQDKKLVNKRADGDERYSVSSLPLTLQFDHRDGLGGGAVSYGALSWTLGDLDKANAQESGRFDKFNLDLVRLQTLPVKNLSLYTRLSSQWAEKNLDSAESFGLGGATGVRAYPTGEASGDVGALAQIELRFAWAGLAPYAFYDYGRVKVDAEPGLVSSPSPDKVRAGAGIGVRFAQGRLTTDVALAWRSRGGAPEAVPGRDPKPRLWMTAGLRF